MTSPFRSKLVVKYFKPWIKGDEKVLDIGCGTGITTKVIKENFKVSVTGCDVKNYLIFNIPFYKIAEPEPQRSEMSCASLTPRRTAPPGFR